MRGNRNLFICTPDRGILSRVLEPSSKVGNNYDSITYDNYINVLKESNIHLFTVCIMMYGQER